MGIETLAIASLGASIIGGGLSFMGQQKAADASQQASVIAQQGAAIQGQYAIEGSEKAAAGTRFTAKAQSDAALYQAAVARNNKKLAESYSDLAIHTGEVESETQNLKTRQTLGTAKAIQAASGVDVNTGSAADVRRTIGELGELDAATIRDTAAQKAFGFTLKGTDYENEAKLAEMTAKNAITAGEYGAETELLRGKAGAAAASAAGATAAAQGQAAEAAKFGSFGSLISSAASVSDKWATYKTKGIF